MTSVFYASVLLLMVNCVITLSKWLWNQEPQVSGSAVNFDNVWSEVTLVWSEVTSIMERSDVWLGRNDHGAK